MAECIEREVAKKELLGWALLVQNPGYMKRDDAMYLLDHIPAADVAPVVHCRHCRSYNKPRLGWCSVHLDREGPDDFCGYGVRMDGDSDALD